MNYECIIETNDRKFFHTKYRFITENDLLSVKKNHFFFGLPI